MKKVLFVFMGIFILFANMEVFAQEIIVVIAPFEIISGFSRSDANAIEHLLSVELAKTKTIKVLDQNDAMFKKEVKRLEDMAVEGFTDPNTVANFGKALNANAVVLGRMMMLGDERIITARINDLNTEVKAANDMVVKNVSEVREKLPAFTAEIVSNLPEPPLPNLFIGKWRSTINSNGQTLICILDFDSYGSIDVERYDTNRVTKRLGGTSYSNDIKKGRGNGTYSLRKSGNRIIADISLTLSGVSHEFTAITAQARFVESNPNKFTVGSMKCEFYVTDGEIRDSYKEFHKL